MLIRPTAEDFRIIGYQLGRVFLVVAAFSALPLAWAVVDGEWAPAASFLLMSGVFTLWGTIGLAFDPGEHHEEGAPLEEGFALAPGEALPASDAEPAGGVVVIYPKEEMREQSGVMAGQLAGVGIGVATVTAVLVIAVLVAVRARLTPESS